MTKNDNFKEYGMPVVVLVAICFVTTDGFTKVEDIEYCSSSDSKAVVTDVYKADNDTGYVMTCVTKSFGGDLTMMVGLDANGAITGVKVTDHSDTPGVGTKDQDPEYLAQYIEKTSLSAEDVKMYVIPVQ